MAQKQTILIIEDEKDMLRILTKRFRMEKLHVLTASNGRDGLSVALEKRPDIIVLDVIMPHMDGLTMMKELRQDSWGKTVPIIFLTNLSENSELAELASTEDFTDYLIKVEWRLEDIVAKVNKILSR